MSRCSFSPPISDRNSSEAHGSTRFVRIALSCCSSAVQLLFGFVAVPEVLVVGMSLKKFMWIFVRLALLPSPFLNTLVNVKNVKRVANVLKQIKTVVSEFTAGLQHCCISESP